MSAQVSKVSAGVESSRQAPAASGAGSGCKDDKRDGRKPPRKNFGRVGKTAKHCYICRKPGHLQKDCPYIRMGESLLRRFQRELEQSSGQTPAGPRTRRQRRQRRRARHATQSVEQPGQESVAPQEGNQRQIMQLDAPGENGVQQQQQQQ